MKLSKNNEAEQLLEDVRHLCHDDQFKGTFTLVLLGSSWTRTYCKTSNR